MFPSHTLGLSWEERGRLGDVEPTDAPVPQQLLDDRLDHKTREYDMGELYNLSIERGTLTEEELTVDKIYSGKIVSVGGIKELSIGEREILKIGLLCNNARDENGVIIGDPTEAALIKLGKKYKFFKRELTEENPKIKEYLFSSHRKMMSIVREKRKIKTCLNM